VAALALDHLAEIVLVVPSVDTSDQGLPKSPSSQGETLRVVDTVYMIIEHFAVNMMFPHSTFLRTKKEI
jgi:hypothetical protein